MPLVTETFNQFNGLRPAIAHMQDTTPSIIRGRNFRWKMRGPYSGWGNRVITLPIPGSDSNHPWVASFQICDHSILCTPCGIYQLCEPCGEWELIHPLTPKIWEACHDNDYPWTMALVGDTYFFSHPTVGIVCYNKEYCQWETVDLSCIIEDTARFKEFDLPFESKIIAEPIYGIIESNNRLIVLAYDTVSWSAPDNGKYLQCDVHKSSGFQNLSIARYGRVLSVQPTITGFNVYTTHGIAAFTKRTDEAAYRVDFFDSQHVPINPYAILCLPDRTNLYLSKQGFYSTNGQNYPQPWEPTVGKWLAEEELPRNNYLLDTRSVRMFYSPDTHEIFVSMIPHPSEQRCHDYLYTRSLVYHEEYNKWGSFDQPHFFIGSVNFYADQIHVHTLGFLGPNNEWHHFDESRFNGWSSSSLNSFIEIGVIQAREQTQIDRQSELQQVKLYTGPIMEDVADQAFDKLPFERDNWEEHSEIFNWFDFHVAGTYGWLYYTQPTMGCAAGYRTTFTCAKLRL